MSTTPDSNVQAPTVTTLRQRNRATALEHIIRAQQTTRAEIASACGISGASAATIVADLIADGLVAETGSVSSRGGRPIAIVAPRAEGAYTIGVDVGERGVAVELFDLSLTVIDTEFRGGSETETEAGITQDLVEALTALHDRHRDVWPRVLGIGLGLPGVVETEADGSQRLVAQALDWQSVRIPSSILGVPVLADNGAKTLARAELWFGGARGVSDAAVALLGRGVGLGIITDGRIASVSGTSAWEWGHTKISLNGAECSCGDRGCVEAYLGADALLQRWRSQGGDFSGSGWTALGALLDAAEAGDAAASAVVEETISTAGAALGSIVNLTAPDVIVVGGWVGLRLMERHADAITTAVRNNCLRRFGDGLRITAATFGGDTVALGSALLPIETLLNAPREMI